MSALPVPQFADPPAWRTEAATARPKIRAVAIALAGQTPGANSDEEELVGLGEIPRSDRAGRYAVCRGPG